MTPEDLRRTAFRTGYRHGIAAINEWRAISELADVLKPPYSQELEEAYEAGFTMGRDRFARAVKELDELTPFVVDAYFAPASAPESDPLASIDAGVDDLP